MLFSTIVVASSVAGLAAAAPFSFPLPNGFPNPNATALKQVYKLAGGTLPNGALPSSLSAAGTQTLQLIAANEIFEVAFFTELIANITNKVPGYECAPWVLDSLTAVVNVGNLYLVPENKPP